MDNNRKNITEAQEQLNSQSDLIYASINMKKLTNLQGMARDLSIFAKWRMKGLDVSFENTGNKYIDDVASVITELTKDICQ